MELSPSDRFVVETPENIVFGYELADIGSRFLAILIDSTIQGVLYLILLFGAAVLAARLSDIELPRIVNDSLAVAFILVLFLIQFGYFLFFEIIMNGQTPGKRLFHLRVIKENGYPLSPVDASIRNIVRIIDFFPIAYGVGVTTMFLNKRAKRLGDFAAGTLVVKVRDEVQLRQLNQPTAAVASPSVTLSLAITRLDEKDISLAESFLQRRAELANQAALGLQIAQRLGIKMQLPEPALPSTPDNAIVFLRETVSAYRARA